MNPRTVTAGRLPRPAPGSTHRLTREQAKAGLRRAVAGEGPAATSQSAATTTTAGFPIQSWLWVGGAVASVAGVGTLLGMSAVARRIAIRAAGYAVRYAWYFGMLKLFNIRVPLPPPPPPPPSRCDA